MLMNSDKVFNEIKAMYEELVEKTSQSTESNMVVILIDNDGSLTEELRNAEEFK